jgi:hypothetical protein
VAHQLARVKGASALGPASEISLDQRDGNRAPPGRPVTSGVRVAQGAQQVPDLVLAAKQPPTLQHSRERVLDELIHARLLGDNRGFAICAQWGHDDSIPTIDTTLRPAAPPANRSNAEPVTGPRDPRLGNLA